MISNEVDGSSSSDKASAANENQSAPPVYADPSSASSTTLSSTDEPSPPTGSRVTTGLNFISFRERDKDVKGSWTINTTLGRPPFLPPDIPSPSTSPGPSNASKQPQGFFSKLANNMKPAGLYDRYAGPTPHLRLSSEYGQVEATVKIIGGSSRKASSLGPARIDARSTNGTVKLTITSRDTQRLNIVALSTYGNVEVLIPRDFRGVVRHRIRYGSYIPSLAVDAQGNTLSLDKGVGTSFIGDWSTTEFSQWPSDFVDGPDGPYASSGSDEWPFDILTMDSTNGWIKIKYHDEK